MDVGVEVGLKEGAAVPMQGSSCTDNAKGELRRICSLNRPNLYFSYVADMLKLYVSVFKLYAVTIMRLLCG